MNMTIGKTGAALLASFYLSMATPVVAGDAEANALLVEAVQLIQKSQSDTSPEAKLEALNEAIAKLEEIVSDHPSSGLAVSLVTGQKIGTVDPASLGAEHARLSAIVAERDAAERLREEKASKHAAWVAEMMVCAEDLECVDAFTAELNGEPLRVPPGAEPQVLKEFHDFVIRGIADHELEISDEQLRTFEQEGFARNRAGSHGYLRRLAIAGDGRFPDYVLQGTGETSIDAWVANSTSHYQEPNENFTSVVIHAAMSDGGKAALARLVGMRAALHQAIARQQDQTAEADQDPATRQGTIENLSRDVDELVVDSVAVLGVSMIRGDIANDPEVIRAALEIMFDEIGIENRRLWSDYSHAVVYLASFILRDGLSSGGDVPMFSVEAEKENLTVEDRIAACGASAVKGIGASAEAIELVTETGQNLALGAALTEPALLYFGYSSGNGATSLDLTRNAQSVEILERQGHRVTPVFISIDPDRDTPQRLAEFTNTIHPRLLGLTGRSAQVSKAAKAYRVYYKAEGSGSGGHYNIDHSTFSYLHLPGLGVVDFIMRGASPEEVAEKTSCLIEASR